MGKPYKITTITGGIIGIIFSIIVILWMAGFAIYGLIITVVEFLASIILLGTLYMPTFVTLILLLIPLTFCIAGIVMSAINFTGNRAVKVLGFAFAVTVLIDLILLYFAMYMAPAPWFQSYGGLGQLVIIIIWSIVPIIGTGLQLTSVFLSRE